MSNPLSLLRHYNMNKIKISEKNDYIIFGKHCWPKYTSTNYLVWGSGEDGAVKKYYTLECLLYLLKYVHLNHVLYVKQARAENIPIIRRPDRKKLLAYLNGETSTSPSIDESAPFEIPIIVKHEAEEENQQEVFKKPRLEEAFISEAKCQQAATQKCFVNTNSIRSLSDALSVEMIAAIKAKRLAKKASARFEDDAMNPTIKSVQEIISCNTDITEDINNHERQLTHATIVQSYENEGDTHGAKDPHSTEMNISKNYIVTEHIGSSSDTLSVEMVAVVERLVNKVSTIKEYEINQDFKGLQERINGNADIAENISQEKLCHTHAISLQSSREDDDSQWTIDPLTNKMDATKESSIITEHIRSSPDVMSAEMIAVIKAKRLQKKASRTAGVEKNQSSVNMQERMCGGANITANTSGKIHQHIYAAILQRSGKENDTEAKYQHCDQMNVPKESSVMAENIRSLSDVMSAEMIAAIKAKRLAKKMCRIKMGISMKQNMEDIPQMSDSNVDITQDISSHKEQLYTITAILQSSGQKYDVHGSKYELANQMDIPKESSVITEHKVNSQS